jgi:hypothetical protein
LNIAIDIAILLAPRSPQLLGAFAVATWFMRLSAATCLGTIVVIVSLVVLDCYRDWTEQSAMKAATRRVEELGGKLSVDLVGNQYVIVLHGPAITDTQIAELVVLLQPLSQGVLQQHPNHQLFAFNLAGTSVSDVSIEAISTLPVAWLNLNGTQVTDQGLLHLRNQEDLSLMTVADTRITRPGVQAFQGSLPQVWISTGGTDHGLRTE